MRGTAILNRGKDSARRSPRPVSKQTQRHPGTRGPEPGNLASAGGSTALSGLRRARALLRPAHARSSPPPRPGPRTQQGCLRRGSWLTVPCLCDFVPRSLLLTGPPSPLVRARPNGLVLTALHLEDLKSKRKSCGLEREHRNSGSHSSVYNNAPLPSQSTVSHRHAAKTPHTQHLTI